MRSLSLLIFALATSAVLGCEPFNWLSLSYGLAPYSPATTTQSVLDSLRYCASLKVAPGTCCSESVINGFQDKADLYMTHLQGNAADRDEYILQRRDEIADKRGAFERIKAASDKLTNYSSSNGTLLQVMATAQATYGDLVATLANWDELVNSFADYQNARSTCTNTLMEIVAATWCLACTPNLNTIAGVDTPTGSLSFTLPQKRIIRVECFPYIQQASAQSKILTAYYYRNYLDQLAGSMERLAGGDSGEYEAVHTLIEAVRVPENEITGPGKFPEECPDNTNCEWIFNELLDNGVLKNATLIRGGSPLRSAAFVAPPTRILSGEDEGRMLAAGTWAPAANEIVLDLSFDENPGKFETNSAPLRNGFIACIITLVASLFL